MSQLRAAILLSRLRAGQETAYERAHRRVPDDLLDALSEAGIRDWVIWRDRQDLLHVVDVGDYAEAERLLADLPANLRWQQVMAEHVEGFVEPGTVPAPNSMLLVWAMHEQLAEREASRGAAGSGR